MMEKIRTVWTARTIGANNAVDPVTQSRFEREQKRLSRSLTGDSTCATSSATSYTWIQSYFEARAKLIWEELIIKTVDGLDEQSKSSDLHSKTLLFAVIGKAAQLIKDIPDASLDDIVEGLETNDQYLQAENLPKLLNEDGRDLYIHLVFHIVGWVTALWDPVLSADFGVLKVADDHSKSRRRSLLHTPTVRNLSIGLAEASVPIYQLLTRFGDLFPNPDSLLREQDIGQADIESACITSAYVSFHNLKNVLNVNLQWTNTLNQHLEYDRRRKVLHVFSAPSICATTLQLSSEPPLARLFEQYRTWREKDNEPSIYQYADFKIYITEILISYRLIFGFFRKSRKQIRSCLPPGKLEGRYTEKCDPLLEVLCTKTNNSTEIRALFNMLGVEEIGNYVSLEEFQFLGKRLLRLERISKSQNPSHVWAFWNDRRDSMAWFATWAVLILGGGTLLFQMLQLVFQIHQV